MVVMRLASARAGVGAKATVTVSTTVVVAPTTSVAVTEVVEVLVLVTVAGLTVDVRRAEQSAAPDRVGFIRAVNRCQLQAYWVHLL